MKKANKEVEKKAAAGEAPISGSAAKGDWISQLRKVKAGKDAFAPPPSAETKKK